MTVPLDNLFLNQICTCWRDCCSVAQSCLTLCDPMDTRLSCPSLSPGVCSNSHPSVMPSNHLISVTLFSSCPQSFPAWGSFLVSRLFVSGYPNYLSFSISPFNKYSGLISFRIDWLDLLAVQGTLKSLLQHQNLKPSILWCLAFFMIQLSHPYMIIGKTITLTTWTFVRKVMSLLFNMLSSS